ncbi:hypothetical protein [Stenotrophomonas maltophilia]|uniref:ORC-CDC6 family AAA ATPase n=1 Tax=Stenotrophomonas maltophilia TaxID=40324 RepID=UPI0021C96A6E|nr:hypothetical protein [Stenotrophomonas maltophilia]MCU1068847.1 hypothetical protein [Stenotrophomonas maltophilia]MCU1075198.1 hypothetical protein [Stenotrophomonas maltophilia]MCU1140956.1 hypothetical protein [Stenotrophomonas maltophilia]
MKEVYSENLTDNNPFELNKASDYSDRQVQDYWVDVEDLQLTKLLKLRSAKPLFLLGGKGSGKTHLMRYCSSTVQLLRKGSLEAAAKSDRYLGIYTSIDGLNVHRFSGKGQSDEAWASVFAYSFELWLAVSLLGSLRTLLEGSPVAESRAAKGIVNLADPAAVDVPPTISGAIDFLNDKRSRADGVVNNSAIRRTLDGIDITFNSGDLVFGIPELLAEVYEPLSKILFIYLIDEVENFTDHQQRFLNTLIRYRRGPVTLRVGSRINGIKTQATLGSGELIRRDAEFDVETIDEVLRELSTQYERLAHDLVIKRLKIHQMDGVNEEAQLKRYFAEPNSSDYYREQALALVNGRDRAGSDRPHLLKLKRQLTDVVGAREIVDQIIGNLSVVDHPVLEKLNIVIFFKRLSRGGDLLDISAKIRSQCERFRGEGKGAEPAYYETYNHFSSDIFAQLYRDYGKRPVYAGFRNIIRLSQGIPRNLLTLLKNIYRRSDFAGEMPFAGGVISVEAQTYGVQDSADWFWEDAQPDGSGTLVRYCVENVATLLRAIRYSDNPSECDLCSFLLSLDRIDEDAAKGIRAAVNWSFLIQVDKTSNAKNDGRVLYKFQVNPMLAARWGISGSRRGSVELNDELANAIFGANGDGINAQQAIRSRVEGMDGAKLLERWKNSREGGIQEGLFNA